MLITVYNCRDPNLRLSFPFRRVDGAPETTAAGKICVVFVDRPVAGDDTACERAARRLSCRVAIMTSHDEDTRARLRAAAADIGFAACDPTAASIEDAVRTALRPHMLMVGRAINTPVPPPVEDLFGKVCYVKCTANHAGNARFVCCSSNSAVVYTHPKFADLHRGCDVKVYAPENWENNRRGGDPCRVPPLLRTFTSRVQYEYLPDLKKQAPGWLSTGTAALMHLLFETAFAGDVYLYGFSHFDEAGDVVTPPRGMQNAFGRPAGRHDVEFERRAMEIVRDTGRVAPFHAADVYCDVPEHVPMPVEAPKAKSKPKPKPKPKQKTEVEAETEAEAEAEAEGEAKPEPSQISGGSGRESVPPIPLVEFCVDQEQCSGP